MPDTPMPEMHTTRDETPVFYEALAAAAGSPVGVAEMNFHEVEDMTDLHRVETYLELTAAG